MFGKQRDAEAVLAALRRSLAVIEFKLDGTIITANQNFCSALGYSLDEIKGRHHSMFVEPATKDSAEYRQFWDELRAGKFNTAQFKRIGKGGKEVWIEASYTPVLDRAIGFIDVGHQATPKWARTMAGSISVRTGGAPARALKARSKRPADRRR